MILTISTLNWILPTYQITKKDVDQFEKGRWIPECQLVVQWERKDQKPVQLRHKVILTGAEAPYNFIYLFLDPAEPGRFICGYVDRKHTFGTGNQAKDLATIHWNFCDFRK